MFNWFSLDIIYYPVSAIMWVWYKLFAFLLGPSNFFAWALSVMFLVFTLRAILYKPFVRQIRTTRQMQELQPQIKALQKKYGKDRQRMALEMQKLQREHGFNPILGCLPMLAQIPVFLGLYHVLMSFNRTQTGIGRLGLSVDENRSLGNYVFSATDVGNFLDANLFGAPLSATMIQQHGLEAFTEFNRAAVIAVGVPIMVLAGIATYFNSRASVARQSPEAAANPQTAMMNKLALYVFPLGVVVGGPFLPLAVIMYWLANNIWTFGQQHYVFGKIEKEEEAKRELEKDRQRKNAPLSGSKPKWPNNYDAAAETRKGTALLAEGKGESAVPMLLKAWDYLTATNKKLKRTDGQDALRPGGLLVELASTLGLLLRANGHWEQAYRVHEAAANEVMKEAGAEPNWVQLGAFFLHRGALLNISLTEKKWSRAAADGISDMHWLDRWETVELPKEFVADAGSSEMRRLNRFMWNFRVATALYQQKKFNEARPYARAALGVMKEWPPAFRDSQRSLYQGPGGYVPSAGFDEALMLLVSAARSDGSIRGWLRARREKKTRSSDALRAISLLSAEVEAVESSPDKNDADVRYIRGFYRGGLQQVASLYMRYATNFVASEIRSGLADSAQDAGVDLLATALDEDAEQRLRQASEGLEVKESLDKMSAPVEELLERQLEQTGAGAGKTSTGSSNRAPRPGAGPRPGARPKKRKR